MVVAALVLAFLEALYSISAGMYSRKLLIAAAAAMFVMVAAALSLVRAVVRSKYFDGVSEALTERATATFAAFAIGAFLLAEFFQSSTDAYPVVFGSLSVIITVLVAVAGWFISGWLLAAGTQRPYLSAALSILPLFVGLLAVSLWFVEVDAMPRIFVIVVAVAVGSILAWVIYHDRTGKLTSALLLVTATAVVGAGVIAWFQDGIFANQAPRDNGASRDVKRVILLTVDTLRWDAVSLDTASQQPATPNIGSLADDSVVFTQARSAGPWTVPAFASIMTGLSPTVHGLSKYGVKLTKSFTTLAETLQSAGYTTAAIGSNPVLNPALGLAQGFGVYDFYPKYPGWDSVGARLLRTLAPHRFRAEVSTGEITDLAVEWLQDNRETDFFLWLHYYDPHLPYEPPDQYADDWPSTDRFGDKFDTDTIWKIRKGQTVLTREERSWVTDLYQAEVSYIDDNIGRLTQSLRELGIYDDTLIVFSSDHGEEFWEHGGIEHGHSVYDELLRVPLMFKLPDSHRTSRTSEPVLTQAIYSTILEICNVAYEDVGAHARPLVAAWENPGAFEPEASLSTGVVHYEEKVAIVSGNHKYIRGLVLGEEQLFDLTTDPGEQHSIAHKNEEQLTAARALLKENIEKSDWAREQYQLAENVPQLLDRETLELLKAVGYVDE